MKFLKTYGLRILVLGGWLCLMGYVQLLLLPSWRESGHLWWLPLVWGGVNGLGTVFLFVLFSPRQHCPHCGSRLPRFFKPHYFSWRLLGSWNCPACGTVYDRHGRILKQPSA